MNKLKIKSKLIRKYLLYYQDPMLFLKIWRNFYKQKQHYNAEAIIKNSKKDTSFHIESLREKRNIFLWKFIRPLPNSPPLLILKIIVKMPGIIRAILPRVKVMQLQLRSILLLAAKPISAM
jgi:hypothetical protein